MGQPTKKSKSFGPSARRLLGVLGPQRTLVWMALAFALVSVGLNAVGPKILGRATDLIFGGLVGRMLGTNIPAGTSRADVIAAMRAQGQDRMADMLQGVDFIPGQGIDFAAIGQVLLVVLAIYVVASVLSWLGTRLLGGVVQRAMLRMRGQVQAKLDRLPLASFDNPPRGELLSRVTNDIDNVSTSLQQTMSQLLNSLLTVVAMLRCV